MRILWSAWRRSGRCSPFSLSDRWRAAAGLLNDPVRAVRIESARLLAAVPGEALSPADRLRLERAIGEYIAAQELSAERPEANANLGDLYAAMNKPEAAVAAYRAAIARDATFLPAIVNLADLYRALGRDGEGAAILGAGIARNPEAADLWHARGLLKVRQGRLEAGIADLKTAAELAPSNPRYSYIVAIALNSQGHWREALDALEAAHRQSLADRDILTALATINRDHSRAADALLYARKLFQLDPSDPAARQLLQELGRAP